MSPRHQILKSILSLKYELILPAKRAWSYLISFLKISIHISKISVNSFSSGRRSCVVLSMVIALTSQIHTYERGDLGSRSKGLDRDVIGSWSGRFTLRDRSLFITGVGGKGHWSWMILVASQYNLLDPLLRPCKILAIPPHWMLIFYETPFYTLATNDPTPYP